MDAISDILNVVRPPGCSLGAGRHTMTKYAELWREVWESWTMKRDADTVREQSYRSTMALGNPSSSSFPTSSSFCFLSSFTFL